MRGATVVTGRRTGIQARGGKGCQKDFRCDPAMTCAERAAFEGLGRAVAGLESPA